jgi:hypothetical protein
MRETLTRTILQPMNIGGMAVIEDGIRKVRCRIVSSGQPDFPVGFNLKPTTHCVRDDCRVCIMRDDEKKPRRHVKLTRSAAAGCFLR